MSAAPSRWSTDVVAGVTTFLTMAYIVIVNPAILSTPGTGMVFSGVMTATVLLAASMTLLMGLYAKLPFGVAPGMGINAYFTFSLVLGSGVPWPTALGIIFWAGVLFLVLSVTNVRVALVRAIPSELRVAAAVGIGLFLTLIGLKNAGLVISDSATLVKLGPLTPTALLSVGGLLLMTTLTARRNPLAFIIGIATVTAVGMALGYSKVPDQLVSPPDFTSMFGKLDIWGALQLAYIPAMLTIAMTDLFDSLSTFMGVSQAAGLVDKQGEPHNLKRGLIVDAWATLTAGIFGTSSGTAFIESMAGIEAGGRTGRSAVVTALCFLPCLFLAPLAGAVPAYATAPVLIIVGAMMFRSVKELKLDSIVDALPQFLIIALIPLTFSITEGLLWGFTAYVALRALSGRVREISLGMWAIAAISVVIFYFENQ